MIFKWSNYFIFKGDVSMATKSLNRYYNPNPKKLGTNDCVIRSICKATDKDWDVVYRELCEIGFELKVMPNADESWKEYLMRNHFIQHKVSNRKGMKRPTVSSFAAQNKKGTYILRVANHLVACVDGYYYDTWDCGDKSLYGYWEKKEV